MKVTLKRRASVLFHLFTSPPPHRAPPPGLKPFPSPNEAALRTSVALTLGLPQHIALGCEDQDGNEDCDDHRGDEACLPGGEED